MKKFLIEVAVGFTDNTWDSVFINVKHRSKRKAEQIAVDRAGLQYNSRVVSFVTIISASETNYGDDSEFRYISPVHRRF